MLITVADFTQQLAALHDRQSEELQLLVEAFRKRNTDLRKERYFDKELFQSLLIIQPM